MAFDVPRRIEAKTYEVGDLISLSGLAGEESFDYPYLIVSQETLVPAPVDGVYIYPFGSIVYPAWNESVSYDWQDYTKTDFQRQLVTGGQWKVWYNGILYEATKWTVPNAGSPPNEQFTDVGDKAGRQSNLKGELLGYATILTNQSHRFRSWKIADEQPNNPYWKDSESMAYFIFNNDYGDDSPWNGVTYKYRSDEPPNAHDMDLVSYDSLPNRSWYFSSPEFTYSTGSGSGAESFYSYGNPLLGGWYIKIGNPAGSPPTYNQIVSHEQSSEGKQYAGFDSSGWNPLTGRMSAYDVYCPHQYDEGGVSNKRSLNLWSQYYIETRRYEQEPESWDITNGYPDQGKIFITAIREFRGADSEYGFPRKDNEGGIAKGNSISFSSTVGFGYAFPIGMYGFPVEDPSDFSLGYNYYYSAWHPMFWLTPIRALVPVGTYSESYYWYTGSPPNQTTNSRSTSVNSGEKWVELATPTMDKTTYLIGSHNDPSALNDGSSAYKSGFYYSNTAYKVGNLVNQVKQTYGNPSASFNLSPPFFPPFGGNQNPPSFRTSWIM